MTDEEEIIEGEDNKTPGELLDDFFGKFKNINSTLPDSVVNHYMKKAGFIAKDPKLIKLVSIASQKFIADIVNDVMQHHKLKTKSLTINQSSNKQQPAAPVGASAAAAAAAAPSTSSSNANATASNSQANQAAQMQSNSNNVTLTMEDLSQVLYEYGINVKKPFYYM